MKISVVIPAYNEEKYIAQCIESILQQKEKPHEIIVVDNNSTDTTPDIVRKYPQVTFLHESQQGITPTRNTGFDYATGDIIARTDADTRVPKDWTLRMKKHFSKPTLVALSGPATFYDVPAVGEIPKSYILMIYQTIGQTLGHDAIFGPNMAVRKKAWEQVRDTICMIDKDVHEDIDLAIHLAPVGDILYDPNLVVNSSLRRWKKLTPYLEYPYRYLKTLQKHQKNLLHVSIPQPEKIMKKMLKNKLVKKYKKKLRTIITP